MSSAHRSPGSTRRRRRSSIRAAAAVAVLAALAGCSGSGSDDAIAVDPTTATAPAQDVSGLVDIGGRSIHVECRGSGGPTVVFISGKGVGAQDWFEQIAPDEPAHDAPGDDVGAGLVAQAPSDDAVLPTVARSTRVCAYDRPNTSLANGPVSTPRAQPHTVDLDVDDLHALLVAIGSPQPYVLVAHSYGGLIALQYARTHPDEIGGLVMVDALTPQIEDVLSDEKLTYWDQTNRDSATPGLEGVELIDGFARAKAAGPLPDVPAIVLTADKPYRTDIVPAGSGAELLPDLTEWRASQDLLAQTLGAEHIADTSSGHHIYLYDPRLVAHAIERVVDEVRNS